MKRFFQIIAGIFILIILLLLIIPSLFKGKIEQKVTETINNNISATVSFDKFNLSMFRYFPNLSMGLKGLTITNKEPFEGDTLLYIRSFTASVDLWSAVSGEGIQVNSIILDQPNIWLKVNQDSITNWDVMPVSESTEEVEDSLSSSDFKVSLKMFKIVDANVYYNDKTMALATSIEDFDLDLKGDLSQASTNLDFLAEIDRFNLQMDQTKYINNATMSLDALIGADMENMVFTFGENEFRFNELVLGFNGSIGVKETGYDLDLKLSTKETSFKTLLSMVPEAYLKDFETLQTDGSLTLEANINGHYTDSDHLPAFDLALNVSDGRIQYPDLPKSIENIQINALVENPGGSADQTITNISKFYFKLGNNPFDASLSVKTPVSNATYKGKMKGTIDLASLSDAIPFDSLDLKGLITVDVAIDGDYKMVENEQYENIKANGTVQLKDFFFKTTDWPTGFTISQANLSISPKFMELKSFDSSLGQSDFKLKGRVENYLSYVLKDGTLRGVLEHNSSLINTNQLMQLASTDTSAVSEDTTSFELVVVPKNLNFTLKSNIEELIYDKLVMKDVNGSIRIIDGKIVLDGLRSNMLNGAMLVSGEYNTSDTLRPFVNFDMSLESIDIHQAANSFSLVDSMMPIAKKAIGTVSTTLKFNSLLGQDMSPVLNSINGGGLLKSKGVEISGAKVQNALATMLKDDKYRKARAEDLSINFALQNGNVIVKPFTTNLFGKKITVSGIQGLDQTLDYTIKMPVSRSELNNVAGLFGASIPSSVDNVMVDILVKGSVQDPKLQFKLDEEFKDQAKEELKKEAEKAVNKLLEDEEVKEKVDELKDKLKKLF